MKLNITKTSATATMAAALCFFFAGSAQAACSQMNDGPVATNPAFQGQGSSSSNPLHGNARTLTDPEASGARGIGGNSIVGLWMATFLSQGQIVDQGFDMWTGDGLEILNDTPPPSTGNICLGTYVKIAPNTYLLKHPSWTFDDAGNLNGTAIIRETVTLSDDGMTYKGTFTIDILSLNGTLLQHLNGTLTGVRITVD